MKKALLFVALALVMALLMPLMLAIVALATMQAETGVFGSAYCRLADPEQAVTVVGDGGRDEWTLTPAQLANAAAILSVGHARGLSERAIVIAIQVAIGESRLRNLANDGSFVYPTGSTVMTPAQWESARLVARESLAYPHDGIGADWDSIGLFQQRPSAGWGSPQELLDQTYAAGAFYDAMERLDWESMTNVEVIRFVQRNVNPETYSQFEPTALQLVRMPGVSCDLGELTSPLPGWRVSSSYSPARPHPQTGIVQLHAGTDIAAPRGTVIVAAASGVVSHTGCTYHRGRSPCQIIIDHGGGVESWYVHMYPPDVHVTVGQVVQIGEPIGLVGSNGRSTGPHLHFEIHVDGELVDPEEFYRTRGLPIT